MNNYDDILNNAPIDGQNGQLSKEEYAAKKKAERDGIFTLSDNTALEVATNGDKFQKYLDVQSKFDRYSAVNALLILAQKPESARLGDFNHWRTLGGFVKPGQNAISILEPHEYTKEDGTVGINYNIKKVFDISQVDSRNVKITPPPSYTDRQLLSALISKAPMKISGVDELPDDIGAMTNPQTGEISVRKGMEFADTFRSVAHELSYAEAKSKNNINPKFIAYCASYIICEKYGVDTQYHDFSKLVTLFNDKEAQEVKAELSQIRDVSANIIVRMAKQLDMVNKAAKAQESR